MTAINFIVRPDALYVIADGASYFPGGVVNGFTAKVHNMPHLCAVVASRGNAFAAPMAASQFGLRFRTFDHLSEGLAQAVEDFCERFFPGDETIQLLFGGWSQKHGSFEHLFVSSHPDLAERNAELRPKGNDNNPKKYEVVRRGVGVDGIYAGPAIAPQELAKVLGRPLRSLDDITDIDVFARGILELQREERFGRELGFDKDFCAVGGFGTLTTLTRSGIETRIVIEWPEDRVGVHLAPTPIDWSRWRKANPMPARESSLYIAPSTAMNRKQRRAEKARRR